MVPALLVGQVVFDCQRPRIAGLVAYRPACRSCGFGGGRRRGGEESSEEVDWRCQEGGYGQVWELGNGTMQLQRTRRSEQEAVRKAWKGFGSRGLVMTAGVSAVVGDSQWADWAGQDWNRVDDLNGALGASDCNVSFRNPAMVHWSRAEGPTFPTGSGRRQRHKHLRRARTCKTMNGLIARLLLSCLYLHRMQLTVHLRGIPKLPLRDMLIDEVSFKPPVNN